MASRNVLPSARPQRNMVPLRPLLPPRVVAGAPVEFVRTDLDQDESRPEGMMHMARPHKSIAMNKASFGVTAAMTQAAAGSRAKSDASEDVNIYDGEEVDIFDCQDDYDCEDDYEDVEAESDINGELYEDTGFDLFDHGGGHSANIGRRGLEEQFQTDEPRTKKKPAFNKSPGPPRREAPIRYAATAAESWTGDYREENPVIIVSTPHAWMANYVC